MRWRVGRHEVTTLVLVAETPVSRTASSESGTAFATEAIGYLDTLYRAALRLTRDPAQAEDLVQDTYVRALRYQHSYQTGTNMKAWLFAIMRNLFWDRFKGGRPEDVSLDGDGEVSLYDTLKDPTAVPEADVLTTAQFRDCKRGSTNRAGWRRILRLVMRKSASCEARSKRRGVSFRPSRLRLSAKSSG